MIEFIKGRSVTFTLSFNAEYDPTDIQDIVVKIGDEIVGQLSEETVLTTVNARVFRVELTSAYTAGMRETSNIQVFLDDASMGVRPFEQQPIRAYKQLSFSNTSVNIGSDFTLNLTVEEGSEEIAVDTVTIYNNISAAALKANNLSDLVSATTARTNLGLGTLATQSGTFSGTSSGTNTGDQNLSGYELLSNKQTDLTASATKYPTVNAVNTGLATKLTTPAGLTTNFVTKWNGSAFANSLAFDNGDSFSIGTNIDIDSYSRLYVYGGVNGANIDARPGGGGYDQSIIDLQGSDFATNFNSAHLRYQGIGATGTTLGYSNTNLADLTYNYTANDRAFLIRSVGESPIVFGINNAIVGKFGTFGLNLAGLTASQLTATDASKNIVSLSTATYPSLTELSHIKGLISPAQTQLDGKQASMGADDNYVTDAQLVVIGNTSGTNTGDQTNISGNAATVTTNANLTGVVTSTGNATTIADAALSIAKVSGLQSALAISGSYSGVGTATTSFTVTIGQTMGNSTYKVNVTPTSALSAALFYVTNKTANTFDVVYLAGLTGSVTFDYSILA